MLGGMPAQEHWDSVWVAMLLDSHRRLLGRELPGQADGRPSADWLYHHAPFCVVAHDGNSDPRFVYANLAAQRCFEYPWDQFVGLRSRLSAPAPERDERDALLASVAARGCAEGYRGLRIARSGRRFWIENVTVWNVHDADGRCRGQAAAYLTTSPA
jgi:hypothetical protein